MGKNPTACVKVIMKPGSVGCFAANVIIPQMCKNQRISLVLRHMTVTYICLGTYQKKCLHKKRLNIYLYFYVIFWQNGVCVAYKKILINNCQWKRLWCKYRLYLISLLCTIIMELGRRVNKHIHLLSCY